VIEGAWGSGGAARGALRVPLRGTGCRVWDRGCRCGRFAACAPRPGYVRSALRAEDRGDGESAGGPQGFAGNGRVGRLAPGGSPVLLGEPLAQVLVTVGVVPAVVVGVGVERELGLGGLVVLLEQGDHVLGFGGGGRRRLFRRGRPRWACRRGTRRALRSGRWRLACRGGCGYRRSRGRAWRRGWGGGRRWSRCRGRPGRGR